MYFLSPGVAQIQDLVSNRVRPTLKKEECPGLALKQQNCKESPSLALSNTGFAPSCRNKNGNPFKDRTLLTESEECLSSALDFPPEN